LTIEEKEYEEEKKDKKETKKKNKKKEKEQESLHCPWPRRLLFPFKIGWRRKAALESDEVNWNWTV
jgi:hypothetical protein